MNDQVDPVQGVEGEAAESTVNMVTLEDGRELNFGKAKKMIKEADVTEQGIELVVSFVNGAVRKMVLPESLILTAAAHGLSQKAGDEIAALKDVDDAILAIEQLFARLTEGTWNKERESNGMAGTSILARALVEVFGKPIEAIKACLANKSAAEKLALRRDPRIKPVVDRLEEGKTKKTAEVDVNSLLNELG